MNDFLINTTFPALISAVVFIIMGAITYIKPPKSVNYLYGYRTNASMQSQERWEFAQKHSSILMIKAAVVMLVISLLAYFIPGAEEIKMIAGVLLAVFSVGYMFLGTEKALKKKFKN